MHKKAFGTHVDWVLSMGIFLLYLIFLIIIIKPGYKSIYTQDVLLSIVEDNFEKNVSWVIKKMPLVIRICKTCGVEGPCVIDANDEFGEWNLDIYDINYNPMTEIKCETTDINPNREDEAFLLFAHPKKWYDFKDPSNDPKVDLSLSPGLIEDCCEAELGTSEDIKGISEEWLNKFKQYQDLDKANYDVLKEIWKYPKQKDFVIYVDKNNNEKYEENEKITNSPEPYQQANVFVKEYKTWIVKKDGNKELVKVSLRIW